VGVIDTSLHGNQSAAPESNQSKSSRCNLLAFGTVESVAEIANYIARVQRNSVLESMTRRAHAVGETQWSITQSVPMTTQTRMP